MGVLMRLADADANSEGHDLVEHGGVRVSWGWLWLEWSFGVGMHVDPYTQNCERFGGWLSLGPLSLGFVYERPTGGAS